jgi:hypothetical protein
VPIQDTDGVVVECDHAVSAVGLRIGCLDPPAVLRELRGDGTRVGVEVRLRPRLPTRLATAQAAERDQVPHRVQPVLGDEVEVGGHSRNVHASRAENIIGFYEVRPPVRPAASNRLMATVAETIAVEATADLLHRLRVHGHAADEVLDRTQLRFGADAEGIAK